MSLLKEIPKTWDCCRDCPMNYDGISCRVYPKEYDDVYGIGEHWEESVPFGKIPDFCKIQSIRFYDQISFDPYGEKLDEG